MNVNNDNNNNNLLTGLEASGVWNALLVSFLGEINCK